MYKAEARIWAFLIIFLVGFAVAIPFVKKSVAMGIMAGVVIFCIVSALYTY